MEHKCDTCANLGKRTAAALLLQSMADTTVGVAPCAGVIISAVAALTAAGEMDEVHKLVDASMEAVHRLAEKAGVKLPNIEMLKDLDLSDDALEELFGLSDDNGVA